MIYLDDNKNIEIFNDKIIFHLNEDIFSKESAILASNSLADEYDIYFNSDKKNKIFLEIYSKSDNLKDVANIFNKRLLSYQSYLIFKKQNKDELELMSYYIFDKTNENQSDDDTINSDVEKDTDSIFLKNQNDEELSLNSTKED